MPDTVKSGLIRNLEMACASLLDIDSFAMTWIQHVRIWIYSEIRIKYDEIESNLEMVYALDECL